ncbi:MAG: dockerin type I domain-containing protein [Clostridium sp.]|nr:dockerin type I domain-containing protein [Clostridium sp.]MCM1546729.1 dockerin type I domain-containing protein [Ruminococcus sp.]
MRSIRAAGIAAALLLCTVLSPAKASAEDYFSKISLSAGYGSENDITEVKVNISSSGISAYSIEVNFDPRSLYFVDAEQGESLDGGTFYCNENYSDNAVKLVWSNSRNQKCSGAAAVLHFKAAYGTAETDTKLSIKHAELADDLEEEVSTVQDCAMKIARSITKGDVDENTVINVADLIMLNKYLLSGSEYPLSYTRQANADVSGNGIVTMTDSALILNYLSMQIEGF